MISLFNIPIHFQHISLLISLAQSLCCMCLPELPLVTMVFSHPPSPPFLSSPVLSLPHIWCWFSGLVTRVATCVCGFSG
jgi:hypothetical protein